MEVSAKESGSNTNLNRCLEALGEEILTVFKDEYDTNYDHSSLIDNKKDAVTIESKKIKKKKEKDDSGCC